MPGRNREPAERGGRLPEKNGHKAQETQKAQPEPEKALPRTHTKWHEKDLFMIPLIPKMIPGIRTSGKSL